jgi:hypothetical protein
MGLLDMSQEISIRIRRCLADSSQKFNSVMRIVYPRHEDRVRRRMAETSSGSTRDDGSPVRIPDAGQERAAAEAGLVVDVKVSQIRMVLRAGYPTRFFRRIELPELLANPSVTGIDSVY